MKKFDIIIIGAGPAGIITGVTAKKQHLGKSILMFKEEEKGLVPCGIPYVFHKLDSVDKNMMGPKAFVDLGGEVLTEQITGVNIKDKIVITEKGNSFGYEKLVFATGSEVVVPDFISGYDLNNVFYIKKSYEYIKNIHQEL